MAERNTVAFRAQLADLPSQFHRTASARMGRQVITALVTGRVQWPHNTGRSRRSFFLERESTGRMVLLNRTTYARFYREPVKRWVRRNFKRLARRARILDDLKLSRTGR